jgi:RNA polymerase sigma factor FliA
LTDSEPGSAERRFSETSGTRATLSLTEDQTRLVIDEYSNLVFRIARKIHKRVPRSVLLEDLYSAGIVGLLESAQRFDWATSQFEQFAGRRIRGAIIDSLRLADWSPRSLRRKGRVAAKVSGVLMNELGRSPSDSEVADRLRIDLHTYQQMMAELEQVEIKSLHAQSTQISSLGDLLLRGSCAFREDPLASLLKREIRQRLISAVNQLSDVERLVIFHYYFAETASGEAATKDIAMKLEIRERQVRRTHWSAIKNLRLSLDVQMKHK